jgi:pimeloyl-ACP methyl ester carboxylesterase
MSEVSETDRRTLTGIGLGVAAAGLATMTGLAVDRLWRDREHALALGMDEDFTVEPTRTQVVVADDGVPLHVEIDEPDEPDPERPTVVLGHGYTLDLRSWVYQRRALREAGYRVVLWDHRGHGSSGVAESETYHVEQLGHDLRRVLVEAVPEGPLVLVGHSMGGMTIMALAEADPELVRERVLGVALVSTSAGGLHRITWGLGSLLGGVVNRVGPLAMARLAGHQSVLDAALQGGRELQDFLVARGSFASPVSMAVVRLTADMIFGTTLEVMSAYVTGLNRHDKAEALAHLAGREVLVLNGDHDVLTSPVHSEELVERMPWAEHVVVEDAGHIITLEHPEVVTRQLLGLIRRAERAAQVGHGPPRPSVRRWVTDVEKMQRDRMTRPRRPRLRRATA